MTSVFRIFKSILFWSHGRTTWQYDILCVLILAFVFLTPKGWFDQGELKHRGSHPNGSAAAASRLVIWPERMPSNEPDTQDIERRTRIATGRPDARVKAVREVRDNDGRAVAYEVDIE